MSKPSATRVAARHLTATSALLRDVMDALRPIYVGSDDDLDMFADDVLSELRAGLKDVFVDPLKKAKITEFSPRREEYQDSFDHDGSGRRTHHYWCKVEYPSSVTASYGIRVNLQKRWEAAIERNKRHAFSDARNAPLTPAVIDGIKDMMVEIAEELVPEYLSDAEIETIETALYSDPFKGIDTDSETSEISGYTGEEEKSAESFSVDARFHYRVDTSKVRITGTPEAGGKVLVRYTIPIVVSLSKVVSPYSNDYMEHGR